MKRNSELEVVKRYKKMFGFKSQVSEKTLRWFNRMCEDHSAETILKQIKPVLWYGHQSDKAMAKKLVSSYTVARKKRSPSLKERLTTLKEVSKTTQGSQVKAEKKSSLGSQPTEGVSLT